MRFLNQFIAIVLCVASAATSLSATAAAPQSKPSANQKVLSPWFLYRHRGDEQQLIANADLISSISVHARPEPDKAFFDKCRELKIEVYKLVGNHKPDAFDTPEHADATIQQYLEFCEMGYDGIDLDFESLDARYEQAYSDFMLKLSSQLHSRGKKLSICAGNYAAMYDEHSGQKPFHAPKVMAECCDMVRVMCYDMYYCYIPNMVAGPNTTYPWSRQAMQAWTKYIPPEKLLMGLPSYGNDYDMTVGGKGEQVSPGGPSENEIQPGSKIEKRWMWYEKVNLYRYTANDGHPHLRYATDAMSTNALLDVLDDLNLAGVSIWHYQMMTPEMWQTVRQWLDGKKPDTRKYDSE
jgi:hypothetical protein